jgi:hypothetical protein
LAILEKAFADEGERGVKALADARDRAKELKVEIKGVVKATFETAEGFAKWADKQLEILDQQKLQKDLAREAAKAAEDAAMAQHEMILNFTMLRDIEKEMADEAEKMAAAMFKVMEKKRLDEFNEKMRTWKSTFEEVKSAAMAVGGILVDNVMKSIDAAVEGTFRWRKALQETAKDLAKMLLRQALMAAVQFGAGALAGAFAGPAPTPPGGGAGGGMPARAPFSFAMRSGGVLGGFPSAQQGMLFNNDQLVRVGDNQSRKEAGIFPLARGRHGRLGVEAVGAQPTPIQVNFNINTIDERGVEGWLFENRHKMADVTGLSHSEGRTGRSSF